MSRRSPRILGLVCALAFSVGLFFAVPVLAQTTGTEPVSTGFASFAETAGFTTQASLVVIVARLIRTIISFLGILGVIYVIYGGFLYMTAGGDANRVKTAKGVLRNALIGFVLVISSFTIAQFVIRSIEGTTGDGGITSNGGGGGGGCIGCSDGHAAPRHFHLADWNQACSGLLLNTQLQFTFSEAVSTGWISQTSQAPGIEIKDSTGTTVPGTFKARGATITFTPSQACPGAVPGVSGEKCFPAATTYTVVFKPTILKSAKGATLECGGAFTTCSVSFSTGSAIDVSRPIVTMTVPSAAAASAITGTMVPLQARVVDDIGGALVSFFATDALRPVFDAGLNQSNARTIAPDNLFNTDSNQWNTAAYAPQTYQLWAEGSDCAGHAANSPKVAFALTSAQCADGIKNGTETEIDCGGPAPSCGACAGGECKTAADCSVAAPTCKEGKCVSTPRIDRVSPNDGAPGNLVTITGAGFGADVGSIAFLGATDLPGAPSDDVIAPAFGVCTNNWMPTQVVIQVPPGAKSGPIELRASDFAVNKTKADRTNDTFGARLSDFTVNDVVRPGLCPAVPDRGVGGIPVALTGLNFGMSRETSSVYFGNYEADAYGVWNDGSAVVTSPRLDQRSYEIQVFTGGKFCKGTSPLVACTDNAGCASGVPCESNRQGSNTVTFVATVPVDQVNPSIVSMETGWKACSDNSDVRKGEHCVIDSECGSGTCVAASNWGPVGQYVTITGTHFGSAGTVYFTGVDGVGVLGGVDFPAACGNAFWSENSVIVKVPAMPSGSVKVTVEASGGLSNTKDFQVLTDTPGPGICRIDPTNGLANTLVTLYGESLLGDLRTIFRENKIDTSLQFDKNGNITTVVPAGAVTGPMFLERFTPDLFRSNAVPFTVESCTDKPALCSTGTQCCTDGTCRAVCPVTNRASHYSYFFSTGPVRQAPRVVVACNAGVKSPAPWEGWSKPETVCLNAVVQAEFDRVMDQTSLSGNILVQRCIGTGAQPCDTLDPALNGAVSSTPTSVQWQPASNKTLLPNTTYQATLVGANVRSAHDNETGVELGYEPMGPDYRWRFRTTGNSTSTATGPCAIGALAIAPSQHTVTDFTHPVDYLARPIAAGDPCVVLACDASYEVAWSNTHPNEVKRSDLTPTGLQCDQHVVVELPILDVDKTDLIRAVLSNVILPKKFPADPPKSPEDTARLIVDLADPKVTEQWPASSCTIACVNAEIGARFNVVMNGADFTASHVQLFRCINAVCDPTENTQILLDKNLNISYDGSVAAPRLAIKNIPSENGKTPLSPDTYYLVRLSGKIRADSNNTQLSQSYEGSDSKTYAGGYYFWIFRTQKSDQLCGLDRIAVEPAQAVMTRIRETQTLTAVPFGTVDVCAPTGQRLDASAYDWTAWTATDTAVPEKLASHVADMLTTSAVGGEIKIFPPSRLPALCTSQCVPSGADIRVGQPMCGNNTVETNEDCDHGARNGLPGDSCSTACLTVAPAACALTCGETATACALTTGPADCANTCKDSFCSLSVGLACDDTKPCPSVSCGVRTLSLSCCGNGKKEGSEECDAGLNGDILCTSQCLNAGSSTYCGNEKHEPSEECDDGNTSNGDGCSSVCLNEGSLPVTSAQCGNGKPNEAGKECDDGNTKDDDGCSSRCLLEGSSATYGSVCGNGLPLQTGEACDDGNTKNGDGCSSHCLLEGSSAAYVDAAGLNTASFCGDGVVGAGESAACEPSINSGNGFVGPYGVSKIASSAPQEVDPVTKTATSRIEAKAQGKIGAATVSLQCSCTTDLSCGAASANVACGLANCCVDRPTIQTVIPQSMAVEQPGLCRNTALSITFSQAMSLESIIGKNVYLELFSVDGQTIGEAFEKACIAQGGSFKVASAGTSNGLWSRMVNSVRQFFGGGDVYAVEPGQSCLTPLTYDIIGTKINLHYPKLLAPKGLYHLVVVGDITPGDEVKTGVLSANLATLNGSASADGRIIASSFTIGDEKDVCKIDVVRVNDTGKKGVELPDDLSIGLFTRIDEEHIIEGEARSLHNNVEEAITSIAGVYAWDWTWHGNLEDAGADKKIFTVTKKAGIGDSSAVKAGKINGQETVIGETVVTTDSVAPLPIKGTKVAGSVNLVALLCQNPSKNASPYADPAIPAVGALAEIPSMNFSFFYCRDFGDIAITTDDLPEIMPVQQRNPGFNPLIGQILKEDLFPLAGTPDGLGVRVANNTGYLTPAAWYQKQGFKGSPTPTTVGGYQAVQDGNTWYVSAPNLANGKLYPNIYVISYNPNARATSKEAFNRILSTWRFNTNQNADKTDVVTDYNLCKKTTGDGAFYSRPAGTYVSCHWEGDCVDRCVNNTCTLSGTNCKLDADCPLAASLTCDAKKAKLTRDTQRLADIVTIKTALDSFGSVSRHCSATKSQRCLSNAQCSGNETCVSDVPTLDSGTFIRTMSVSNWPSWSAALGNALGTALPQDPVNNYYQCTTPGFAADTCFDSTKSQFQCPDKSQIYAFQSTGGESYQLSARLEYNVFPWANKIDENGSDNATISIENAVANGDGFVAGSSFCKSGTTVGASNNCGDGVKGTGEVCELGEVTAAFGTCTQSGSSCTSNSQCAAAETCTLQRDACTVCVNSTTGALGPVCSTQAECTVLGAGWACPTDANGAIKSNGFRNVSCVKDVTTSLCKWQVPSPAACLVTRCGNGVKEAPEACDDGARNGVYGSHCTIKCEIGTGPTPAPGVSFCGDGYLAGGEQCDCGADLAIFNQLDATSWAKTNTCTKPNGEYMTSGTSCTFDCRAPGPSCGNNIVDGPEQCDGNKPEDYSGKLCSGLNIGTKCTTNADCDGGVCGGSTSDVCPTKVRVCLNKTPLTICTSDTICGVGGTCGTKTYDQVRTRGCGAVGAVAPAAACQWDNWTACQFKEEIKCGNTKVDPGEECDLGSAGNGDNKACTSACKKNVCGDGLVNVNVESCDQGTGNTPPGQTTPAPCSAPYGGNCNYCTTACQYKTLSGAFCGDGKITAPEQCDGTHVQFSCVKKDASNVWQRSGACKENGTAADCKTGESCIKTGICDGGSTNGAICTDTSECGTGGVCTFPKCAANCGSSCPFSYETTALKVTPAIANATPQDSVSLYSADGAFTPTGGLLQIPACLAGSALVADVDNSNVFRAYADVKTVEVIFVTDVSGSMNADTGNGKTRIAVVKESLTAAIDTLFDAYPAGQLKIGLVTFTKGSPPAQPLSLGSNRQALKNTVANYVASGGTPTPVGVQDGIAALGPQAADKGRFVVLLSDGSPTGGVTDVETVYKKMRESQNMDIGFFSAAITTDPALQGYMAHMSRDTCGTTYANKTDCVPNSGVQYDYVGNDVSEIGSMYDSIVAAIVGTTVSYGVQPSGGGSTVYSSGAITSGKGVVFPFPQGFKCQPTPFTVPFSTKFTGQDKTDPTKPGKMIFSNFKLTYCPVR